MCVCVFVMSSGVWFHIRRHTQDARQTNDTRGSVSGAWVVSIIIHPTTSITHIISNFHVFLVRVIPLCSLLLYKLIAWNVPDKVAKEHSSCVRLKGVMEKEREGEWERERGGRRDGEGCKRKLLKHVSSFNVNFLAHWPTDVCLGSNGRIPRDE